MSTRSLWVIPDAHATPQYDGDDVERFKALGEYLRWNTGRRDDVLCLGDFADMPSLSSYDRGRRSFEGRRYQDDIEVARRACKAAFSGLRVSRKLMLLGNHEARIDTATQASPELEGKLSVKDLGYDAYFDRVVPYLGVAKVAGFAASHYFASGVMGRPIGGVSPGNAMLHKLHCSAIAGHSHLLDLAVQTKPTGDKIYGIVAGCFVHPDYSESWCAATRGMWWSGILRIGLGRGDRVTTVEAIGSEEILG
jgi:hypothetical protein